MSLQQRTAPSARRAPPAARLALALAELAIASASLFLCARLFLLESAEREGFLAHNVLPGPQRAGLLVQMFAAAALPIALAGLSYLRARQRAFAWWLRAGEVCAPLILSCVLPALLDYNEWYDKPLPYLIQLLAFGLVLERLVTRAFGRPGGARVAATAYVPSSTGARTLSARFLPGVIVVLFGAGYAVCMSYYTLMRHRMLGTAGFDLGIFDNLMFNALHGHPFRSTVAVPNGSYLSNHAEYGMYLFVPVYALHPGADTLLVLQSTFMGMAALPLYMFCATQISRPAAAAIACAYLFYAPLHGPNFYDFHWMPMAVFFFHWLFYALAKRQTWWVVALGAVICSMREDAAFGLIAAGLFLIVTKYWVRMGVWMTAVSALWFMLVKFVIMPWAGPWWFADIYKDLMVQGEHGYGSIVRTILINPNYFIKTLLTEPKLVYTLHLLAPLLFIPLRNPALALLMLPGFFVTLMTTGYGPTVSIAFQYTTTWIPFLFAAAAIALRLRRASLGSGALRGSVVALCICVLCHSYVYGAILQHDTFVGGFSRVNFDISPSEERRYQDLRAVIKHIPPKASVAATETEIPHVSTRLDAYTLKITSNDADYIFVHRHHLDPDARQRVRASLKEAPYGLAAKQGDFILLGKNVNVDSPESDNALKSLGLGGIHARR